MRQRFAIILFSLVLSSFMISCSKDDTAPTITITQPTDGAIITRGSVLNVKGTVTDDTELSEIIVAGNSITSFTSTTSHTLDINLNIPVTQVLGPTNIEISATDKEGNNSKKQISLIVQ